MEYGIFDTVDQLWIGDESGPKLYDDEDIAKAAAMVAETRVLHSCSGRYLARPWTATAVALKDTVPTLMDSLEAVTLLEEGKAL